MPDIEDRRTTLARDQDNGVRWRPGHAGHYESWFCRANHPHEPRAFWIRYTMFSPRGAVDQARGELWCAYFDADHVVACKEDFPIEGCSFAKSELDVGIGPHRLDAKHLAGRARGYGHDMAWSLTYAPSQAPIRLLQDRFYGMRFPSAKSLTPAPNAHFHGTLSINGGTVDVDGWVGCQSHNWGTRHTDRYAYAQVCGFDEDPDAFFEMVSARIRVGRFWLPQVTVMVARIEGRDLALNSLSQSLRARAAYDWTRWDFRSASSTCRIEGTICAPSSAFVGLPYDNPPGGTKTCLNSKIADCLVTITEPGRPPTHLTCASRAAFEMLTDREDHGIMRADRSS